MLANTTVDGCTLNSEGQWTQNGAVVTEKTSASTGQNTAASQTSVPKGVPVEIPGTYSYVYFKDYKMVSGRMLFQDSDTKLYGYMDGAGNVVIAPQYNGYGTGNFSEYGYAIVYADGGYALIDTSGQYMVAPGSVWSLNGIGYNVYTFATSSSSPKGIIIGGVRKAEPTYTNVYTNGVYIMGMTGSGFDIFDMSGNKMGYVEGQAISYKNGSPLIAVRKGTKYALVYGGKAITDYLYDSIHLHHDSTLAVLVSGSRMALAGENGIILGLGEYLYGINEGILDDRQSLVGGYALVQDVDGEAGYALADATGLVSEFSAGSNRWLYDRDTSANGVMLVVGTDNKSSKVVDLASGEVYPGDYYNGYYIELKDGTYYLMDGTRCEDMEPFSAGGFYYATFQVDGKYGLAVNGENVSDTLCNTKEEAIASYNVYKIIQENGKPVVGYGNEAAGFHSYGIRYYQDGIYYDEIADVGDGYYACRFDTTWYLIRV